MKAKEKNEYEVNFYTLSSMIDECVFITNEKGKIWEVNNASVNKLGFTKDEFLQMNLFQLFANMNQEIKSEEFFRKCSSSETIPLITNNGNMRYFEITYQKINVKSKSSFMVICKDKTNSFNQPLFLKSMIDVIPEYIYFKDVNRRYIGCNKSFAEKFIGLPEEDIIGRSCNELIHHEETLCNSSKSDNEVFSTLHTKVIEESMQLANGSLACMETIKTPFFDDNGEISGLIGVSRNITERRKIENKLKESEMRLHLAITNTDIELWDWDIVKNEVVISDLGTGIMGYEPNEIDFSKANIWKELLHPDDSDIRILIKKCLNNEMDYFEVEHRIWHKRKEWIWVQTRGRVIEWDNNKRPLRMIGTQMNINKIKKIEERLIEKEVILSAAALSIKEFLDSNDYYQALKNAFELIGNAAGIDRINLFQMHENDAGDKLYSLMIKWKAGKEVIDFEDKLFVDVPREKFSFINQLLKGNVVYGKTDEITDCNIYNKLKSLHIITYVLLPIFVKEKFWGVIGFDNCMVEREWSEAEITALKSFGNSFGRAIERSIINDELKKSKKDAENASLLKSRFLANMSHEIRTPMNGIIGFVDLIQKTELSTLQSDYLKEIKSATDTLLIIINDILDYSKIEAQKLELEFITFDITELVKESVDLFLPKATEKGLKVNLFIDKALPKYFFGDPGRLKQVLYNLISNAIKFTETGSIYVGVNLQTEDTNSMQVRFHIKDTGIGMNQQEIGKLFKEFSQADASTTRKYGGTGLGLAITDKLVQMMDGLISVKSQPNKGTEFYVTIRFFKNHQLRLIQNQEQVKNGERDQILIKQRDERMFDQADHVDKNKFNILLVDDTIANQKLVDIILKKIGYKADLTGNGHQAVELCKEKKYDLIFMDCQMPIMDGYEATMHIREVGQNSKTPIIAMTAHAMKGDRDKCLAAGMDDYISKPITIARLEETIIKWLEIKSH